MTRETPAAKESPKSTRATKPDADPHVPHWPKNAVFIRCSPKAERKEKKSDKPASSAASKTDKPASSAASSRRVLELEPLSRRRSDSVESIMSVARPAIVISDDESSDGLTNYIPADDAGASSSDHLIDAFEMEESSSSSSSDSSWEADSSVEVCVCPRVWCMYALASCVLCL